MKNRKIRYYILLILLSISLFLMNLSLVVSSINIEKVIESEDIETIILNEIKKNDLKILNVDEEVISILIDSNEFKIILKKYLKGFERYLKTGEDTVPITNQDIKKLFENSIDTMSNAGFLFETVIDKIAFMYVLDTLDVAESLPNFKTIHEEVVKKAPYFNSLVVLRKSTSLYLLIAVVIILSIIMLVLNNKRCSFLFIVFLVNGALLSLMSLWLNFELRNYKELKSCFNIICYFSLFYGIMGTIGGLFIKPKLR